MTTIRYSRGKPFILYQTMQRMQPRNPFVLIACCLLGLVLFAPASRAADDQALVRFSAAAIEKGYTVSVAAGAARVGILPRVVTQPVTVRLERYPDPLPEQVRRKRVSDIWVVDVLSRSAVDKRPVKLNGPIRLSVRSSSTTLYRKRIFFWEKTSGTWRPLPSKTDTNALMVHAAFPLPYAPFAVFEESAAIEGGASWFRYRYPNGAASNDFPMGSTLRVTDLGNNKSVNVVVQSTGPFVSGRIIDLASKAFAKLRRLGEGVATVRVELLSKP